MSFIDTYMKDSAFYDPGGASVLHDEGSAGLWIDGELHSYESLINAKPIGWEYENVSGSGARAPIQAPPESPEGPRPSRATTISAAHTAPHAPHVKVIVQGSSAYRVLKQHVGRDLIIYEKEPRFTRRQLNFMYLAKRALKLARFMGAYDG